MRISPLLYIALLVGFSSCKAFKTLTAKDNSAPPPSSSSKKKDISFLDDITVTPGAGGDRNITVTKGKSKKNVPAEQPKTIKAVTLNENGNSSMAMLQIKYAGILNVGPEQLTNYQLLQTIDQWWGTRYCYGGQTDDCIDCSGYTQTLFGTVYNLHIPRVAQDQYDSTARVSEDELTEGDLVFFHTSGRGKSITHVGVYITNNKFTHASTSNGVEIADLTDPYWKQRYRGAGKVK
jgi:lipoprotein Spr